MECIYIVNDIEKSDKILWLRNVKYNLQHDGACCPVTTY